MASPMNATLRFTAALSGTLAAGLVLAAGASPAASPILASELQEIQPRQTWQVGTHSVGRFSDRTLVLALDIHSEGAELVAFTAKERPFDRVLGSTAPEAVADAGESHSHRESVGWVRSL
jgi:hypothetical protein